MGGALLFIVLLSALAVGWQALRQVLLESGVYHNLCHNSTTTADSSKSPLDSAFFLPSLQTQQQHLYKNFENGTEEYCLAQTLQLDLVFVIATSALNLGLGFIGPMVDLIGPRIGGFLVSFLLLAGNLLFAFSDSVKFNAYISALSLLTVGRVGITTVVLSLPNMFKPSMRPFLSTAIMSGQDICALTFWIFQLLFHANKHVFSVRNLFLMHIPIVVCYAVFSLFLPNRPIRPEPETPEEKEEKQPLTQLEGAVNEAETPTEDQTATNIPTTFGQRFLCNMKEFAGQFFTIRFFILLLWGSIGLTTTYFYMTTLHDQWLWISNEDKNYADTGAFVFSILMVFVGLLSIPITGTAMSIGKLSGGVIMVGIVNVAGFGITLILVKWLQYVSMCLLIIGRASCFGVWAHYIQEQFTSYNASLFRLSAFVAGIVNLNNYLWTYIAKSVQHGNFFVVNLSMMIALALSTICMLFVTIPSQIQKAKKGVK